MNILVVGCSKTVNDDLEALRYRSSYAVIPVNRMILDWPSPNKILYGATIHHELISQYRRKDQPVKMVSTRWTQGVSLVYDEMPYRNGTSAFYAVGLALLLGAERVICAGVPLDGGPHYYPEPNHFDVEAYRDPWLKSLDIIKGRVFSMSGWTRDLLGPPPL